MDKYNQQSSRGYNISFAYGVVNFEPNEHMSIKALLDDSDAVMYEWKKKRAKDK